ncbi:cysteine hydrolase family protein [Acidithiobacillus ferridurans]|uniref:cysteine hydrolase family protein n=1 Tax=Acidithiobacillus ferridurans TaxID=1232575 RepID=UPI001C06C868|nr:isochorismatase family cysteine hydrolase [Acidithiobacillus ferridurans]MBU2734132.1 cysteine hydrolase [Acidithiobacillus ferridurans]
MLEVQGKMALIVVDMQRDFLEASGYADSAGLDFERLRSIIPNVVKLISVARDNRIMIIFTREGHRGNMLDCSGSKFVRSKRSGAPIGARSSLGLHLIRGSYGHDLIDDIKPRGNEIIIDKVAYSAFYQTDLNHILTNNGISNLLLCGVTTEVCVHSTLRSAIDIGYSCWTISDACEAGTEYMQKAAIEMIKNEGGIFGSVVSTGEAVRLVQAEQD